MNYGYGPDLMSKFRDYCEGMPKCTATSDARYSDRYQRKASIMTRTELEFLRKLRVAVGREFDIYPQVKLDKIVEPKNWIQGESRKGAYRGISQKSVDYLVVKRDTQRPVLAIELDDDSHILENRKERDWFVECVFKKSGMPFMRIPVGSGLLVKDLAKVFGKYFSKYDS